MLLTGVGVMGRFTRPLPDITPTRMRPISQEDFSRITSAPLTLIPIRDQGHQAVQEPAGQDHLGSSLSTVDWDDKTCQEESNESVGHTKFFMHAWWRKRRQHSRNLNKRLQSLRICRGCPCRLCIPTGSPFHPNHGCNTEPHRGWTRPEPTLQRISENNFHTSSMLE